ncbi:MAG: NUDIX hydrolase [Bacteroidetes bacterium]|nr:NUDIX hydrolase [Bacteroidota bacterium]
METKHINELLEQKVTSIFNSAREAAIREFAEVIGIKLSQLDLFHQLQLLMEEFKRPPDEHEKASKHPFYIHNHANLLNQFSSRTFF